MFLYIFDLKFIILIMKFPPSLHSVINSLFFSDACCTVSAANKQFLYAMGLKQGQCSIHTVHSGQTNWQTDRDADRQSDTLAVRRCPGTKTQSLCFSLATILCAAIGSS